MVSVAYHPVFHEKVDQILDKDAIEPSTVGAGCYSLTFSWYQKVQMLYNLYLSNLSPYLPTHFLKCLLLSRYGSSYNREIIHSILM